ncbi:MAG TPA: MgtC/SapB family protein [Pyrinomonadaceae bacterium]
MDLFWQELTFGVPNANEWARIIIRLTAATLFGAAIGLQREKWGKPAGLRTHILVTVGTTLFVMTGSIYGMSSEGLSRVIQGIVTGIGFIGAGSILKVEKERDIQGLTTAAGVWMTSAIGVTIGLGSLGLALIGTILTLIILTVAGRFEFLISKNQSKDDKKTAD